MVKAVLLAALFACSLLAVSPLPLSNWSGPYQVCDTKAQLLKFGHMDLGVRIETSNAELATAFLRALDFWSSILDMSFHEDATSQCSLALVEGTATVLTETNNVARAQFADLAGFEAWIAFDPHALEYMSPDEVYATAVHELGHLFGLRHNPQPNSIMYYLDCDGASVLDEADFRALAARHLLRRDFRQPVPVRR